MDAAMAEDTDVETDWMQDPNQPNDPTKKLAVAVEDIGRFAPLDVDLLSIQAAGTSETHDGTSISDSRRPEEDGFWVGYDLIVYNPDPNDTSWRVQIRRVSGYEKQGGKISVDSSFNPGLDSGTATSFPYKLQRVRYGWAADLFDYFTTIHSPGQDFTPGKDPNASYSPAPDPVKSASDPSRYVNREGLKKNPPAPSEDDVPTEGLININTASWQVLARLPLVMDSTDPRKVDRVRTERLAKRIVYLRDIDDGLVVIKHPVNGKIMPHPHGPFRSIAELNLVPEFASAEGTLFPTVPPTAPRSYLKGGDFSPMSEDPKGDRVFYDFEKKYLNLTRISNLITTRSDAFTVYLQVQGWRDAGTPNAKMVVQRRLAFIVDRSRLTATQKNPAVYNLPVPAGQ
jgi:hypothetical protein